MTQKINKYVCSRLRLLSHLKNMGYLPYDSAPDFKNPKFNVYFFDRDEDGFEEALNKYFERFK